ncbi:MAG TPA: hypothetical protein VMS17_09160 [Gemmataceae bacterium]|nr:hypothetical protein [Gemmataceae bacterium]
MEPAVLDDIEHTLKSQGPEAAVNRLCDRLREDKDYHALFYALLMKKRHELGVSPVPTGPAKDLPKSVHTAYEDAIRDAGRLVGGLYIQDGQLPQAWAYYRMLGEPAPMRAALEAHTPADGEDLQPLVQIAFYEGVHPRKGFDWILDRFGICSAITNIGGQELPHPAEDRQYCLQRLVRALYAELCGRLAADIERHEGKRPAEADLAAATRGTVPKLIEGRDWLFADDGYHIDTSHLSSVVQMAVHLTPCDELHLARELCAYGKRLSPRFHGRNDPPFEDLYEAHDRYLSVMTGDDVAGGLAYFEQQADKAEAEGEGTFPAEVLVNLLLRLERPKDALAVARKHLVKTEGRRLTCPGVAELAQQVGDYRTLAEAAREQGDAVHFLAGLLGARKGGGRA